LLLKFTRDHDDLTFEVGTGTSVTSKMYRTLESQNAHGFRQFNIPIYLDIIIQIIITIHTTVGFDRSGFWIVDAAVI